MADTYGVEPTIFDPAGRSALTYDQLQARRKVALALAARQRGFPKTIGEGLTYFGERINEGLDERYLREREAENLAQRQKLMGTLGGVSPAATPSYVPGATAAPSAAPVAPAPAPAPRPAPRAAGMTADVSALDGETEMPPEAPTIAPVGAPAAPQGQQVASAADVPDEVYRDWKARIYRNETGGEPYVGRDPYQKVGKQSRRGDYPYGVGQVMGENIPVWSQQVLGRPMTPKEFLNDPEAQDKIIEAKGKEYIAKFGPEGAAAAWYAGPNWQRALATRPDADKFGANIAEYMRRFQRPLPVSRDQIAASLAAQSGQPQAQPPAAGDEEGAQPVTEPTAQPAEPRTQLAMRGDMASDAPSIGMGPGAQLAQAQTQAQPPQQQFERAPPAQQPPAVQQPPASYRPPSEEPIAPARSAPFPQFEGPPPQPQPLGPSRNQVRAQQLMNDPRLSPEDKAQAQRAFEQEEGYRKEVEQRQWQIYTDKLKVYNENVHKKRDYELGAEGRALEDQVKRLEIQKGQAERANDPVTAAKLRTELEGLQQDVAKKKDEADVRRQFGNMAPQQVFEETKKSKEAAEKAATGVAYTQIARDAIRGGNIITGFGANQRLDIAKLNKLLGFEDKGDAIANTEVFRSSMAPTVATLLKATVGSTQISNTDRDFAEKAAGGQITLDAKSINRLLDVTHRMSMTAIDKHQDLLSGVWGNNKAANAMFGIDLNIPPDKVERLLANPDRKADFDEKYGTGAANYVLRRRKYLGGM